MRIIGTKDEIDILLHLTSIDSWAYPAIFEMLQHSSLEISENMVASPRRFSLQSPDGSEEVMTIKKMAEAARMEFGNSSEDNSSEKKDSPAKVVFEEKELPQEEIPREDGTVSAARSRLGSIGCVLEDGIATTEQGQKFEVYIQSGSETVESFVTKVAKDIYSKEHSALLIARDCDDKSRLIRIARSVLGPQVDDGNAWFATSPDLSWGKSLVFSNLHLSPQVRHSDDIEKGAALHYAARKHIPCKDSWIDETKSKIVSEVEEGISTIGELAPEAQIEAAKTIVQKVSQGNYIRADLSCSITVRKLIDLDILNPFEQHKVALTDKGVLLAKAWGVTTVSRRATPVDNIVLLVRTLLNGYYFDRDVLVQDGEDVIRVRCARSSEAREVIDDDGTNHLFFAVHDSADVAEFEHLASTYKDKFAVWRISELRENTNLPRAKFRE